MEENIMKRTIIEIDTAKCDGCGVCILCCEEGALEISGEKAVLAREFACDGNGSCIGECPQNAIKAVEKDCPPCSIFAIMDNIIPKGEKHITAYFDHLRKHECYELMDAAAAYLRARSVTIPEKTSNK